MKSHWPNWSESISGSFSFLAPLHCVLAPSWPRTRSKPTRNELRASHLPNATKATILRFEKRGKSLPRKMNPGSVKFGGTSKIVPLIFDVLRIIIPQCTLGLKCTYYYISLHCARTCEFSCALSTWTSSGIPFHRCYIWRAPASPPGQHAS